MGKYDDIMHLTRPQYPDLPQMSVQDRAVQFSPFAALTGFDDAVKETARFTDTKRELAEDEVQKINEALNRLSDMINENPQIELTYFKKDEKKDGGAYVRKVGYVKRLDEYEKTVIFTDGIKVDINDIGDIDIKC